MTNVNVIVFEMDGADVPSGCFENALVWIHNGKNLLSDELISKLVNYAPRYMIFTGVDSNKWHENFDYIAMDRKLSCLTISSDEITAEIVTQFLELDDFSNRPTSSYANRVFGS